MNDILYGKNAIRCIDIQVKDGYVKKYKRACNIAEHQKRNRLKKKWDNIINRYNKKYTTKKYIVGSTFWKWYDRTDYTMPEGAYYSPIAITCSKGPEN